MLESLFTDKESNELTDILQDLVKIKTINSLNNEMDAVDYIAKLFEREGIEYKIIESAPGRGNIVAWIRGGIKEPLLFLSHLDVVDVDYGKWSVEPFSAEIVEGRIFGRGTLDTKQLTAMNLMTILTIARNNIKPDRDLIFVATADEENGSNFGMKYLVENHPDLLPKGFVINEGGGFLLPGLDENIRICASGEKSVLETSVKLKRDDSFIDYLIDLIDAVTAYEPESMQCSVTREFKQKADAHLDDNDTIRNLWEYMSKDSLDINGFNIQLDSSDTEDDLELKLTSRHLPMRGYKQSLDVLDNVLKDTGLDYAVLKYQEGYLSDLDNDFVQILKEESDRYGDIAEMLPIIALGNTDGRFIGHNVYGYSPLSDKDKFDEVLKKVHGNDESISVESLIYGAKVILGTTLRFACNY